MRIFYYINAYICGVAVFSYFSMISGMGWETIMGCRQFFYVRCDAHFQFFGVAQDLFDVETVCFWSCGHNDVYFADENSLKVHVRNVKYACDVLHG